MGINKIFKTMFYLLQKFEAKKYLILKFRKNYIIDLKKINMQIINNSINVVIINQTWNQLKDIYTKFF